MKKYSTTIIFIALSFLTYCAYHLIGFEIANDGTLKEPFALIPLTYLFFSLATVSFAFQVVINQFVYD